MGEHFRNGIREEEMERRTFIRWGLFGLGGSIVAPRIALAAATEQAMAGGVYHTRDAPGRWTKEVTAHVPDIKVNKDEDGVVVRVLTKHPMDGYRHYIVKHMILDKDFRFVAENRFNPLEDEDAISYFPVARYGGPVYVLSVCNQHDTWMEMAEI
jgi:superoxide reductase